MIYTKLRNRLSESIGHTSQQQLPLSTGLTGKGHEGMFWEAGMFWNAPYLDATVVTVSIWPAHFPLW